MNWDFPWSGVGPGLAVAAGAALAVFLAAFAVGAARGVHRVADVAWGVAFAVPAVAVCGVSAGHGDPARRVAATTATVLWGLRLAAHIARRGHGKGEDPRYERMLSRAPGGRNAYALRVVHLPQAALVWLVGLPVVAAQYAPAGPRWTLGAGLALWAAGLACEAVGDAQLARFTADPANKGRIMDRGLWSWTRHPNYFGDFLVWWGLFAIGCGSWGAAALGVLSPLLMSFLLTLGSGKRLLERHMSGRPGWAGYAARTSGFVPLPPRRTVPPGAGARW
jgi:steroid 5-alpha reductase family enzyme